MPALAACCSHRVVDVSGIAELAARWFPAAFHSRPRLPASSSGGGGGGGSGGAHTAAADVRASLEELRHYRATVFKEDNKEAGRAVARRYPYGSHGGRNRGGRR
jgi:oligoribonuclease